MNQFTYIFDQISKLDKRLKAIETFNQVKVINVGDFIKIDGTNNIITVGNNIDIDGANGRILMRDNSGFNRVLMDGTNGIFKISRPGYNVLTATYDQLIISSEITTPREVNVSFGNWSYTNNTNYETLYNCACKIDFNDWADSRCYLEVTGKTGGGTAYYQLYNITDGVAIPSSEVTTTATTATVFRGSAFTKPSGSKQLALQYKVSSASYYTDIYTCRVVMRSS